MTRLLSKELRLKWAMKLFLSVLGLQSACAMGPDYKRPKVVMPSSWLGTANQSVDPNVTAEAQARLADVSWWDAFNDPILRELIDEGLRNNLDLQQAVSRVQQYQALYGVQRSQIGPAAQVGLNAGYGKNPLTQSLAAAGGGRSGGASGSFAATVYATWELDFWGRLRRLNEAALADYLSTEEARQGASLTLVSNIALAYVDLLRLKERALLANRTVQNFNQMLALYELQLSSGAGTLAPVATARAQVADAEATCYATTMQYEQAEVALSFLLGSAPRKFPKTGQLESLRQGPELPLGLPAELLARRPDVRQAEATLRSANAQVGASKAALFPSLSITGLFGGSTASLAHPGPRGSLMSLIGGGPSWALPIPFFGGMQAWHRYDASYSMRTQGELAYRSAVLTALGDVNRAMSARTGSDKVGEARYRQVTELSRALVLAKDRYRQGSTSFVEVTQAQNSLFGAELALIEVRAQQVNSFVALYRSLGGGWH
jgi:multidrug efflux system outer membrane protein